MFLHLVLTPQPHECIEWLALIVQHAQISWKVLAILPSSTVVRQGHMCLWNVPLAMCWSCSTGRVTQGEPAAGQDFWTGLTPFGSHGLLLHRCTCSDFPGPSSIKRVTGVQNDFPRQRSWYILLSLFPLVLKEEKKFSFSMLVDVTSFA